MARKPGDLPRIAPLQRIKAEPITDPAELAILAKLTKPSLKNVQNGQEQGEYPESQPEMAWQVIALCRKLPYANAAWLLIQVASLLSDEELLVWTENLVHHMSQDALLKLEKQLAEKLAKPTS
jgi:hypothetical protein